MSASPSEKVSKSPRKSVATARRREDSSKTVQIAHRPLEIALPALKVLFEWMAERDRIRRRRAEGKPPPWSQDPTMSTHKFCHVFRIFDEGSQFLLNRVINNGIQEHNEICFRVILFNLFKRISTWNALQKRLGPLTWATFDLKAYTRVLERQALDGPIYTSAYQIPPPNLVDGPGFVNHLYVLQMMMEQNLPKQLKLCGRMQDAYELIKIYPGMGQFLSYQMVLDLNMTPDINFSQTEWVVCGPGSQAYLERIFGQGVRGVESEAIRYLYKTQREYYARFQIADPPAMTAGRPGVTCVDIEHSLCECTKYTRHRGQKGSWKASKESVTSDIPAKWTEIPPAGRLEDSYSSGSDAEEGVYEVSHIVKEEQMESGKSMYRIRWTGYGPEEDSWMSAENLKNAPEVLEHWRSRKAMECKLDRRMAKLCRPSYSRKTQ